MLTPTCLRFLRGLFALLSAPMSLAAPADAAAPLPTRLQYASAIAAYQSYTDQSVQSWREANDLVGRIGGWRAYAKEASAKETSDADEHSHHDGGEP